MKSIFLICMILLLGITTGLSQNVVVVVIDGARYSETFGDTSRTYIPAMDLLSKNGAYIDEFYNDSMTWTSRAVPALWAGTWTPVYDIVYNGISTKYGESPSLWEYYRKQTGAGAENAYYVIKEISSLWLQSFHPDYGPDYWPTYHSVGSTDEEVSDEALMIMSTYHPQLLWIYLADVDHGGHSGSWEEYVTAISIADSITGLIWETIQSDSFYKDNTTMLVTNDHGRHDDEHGGQKGHGDGCPGCRRIMMLAMGPQVKKNFVSTQYRRTPDVAVTAASILNVDPEYATGDIMDELFEPMNVEPNMTGNNPNRYSLGDNYPNPFNPVTTIEYTLTRAGNVSIIIYNILGEEVIRLVDGWMEIGSHSISWYPSNLPSGVYFYRLTSANFTQTKKMILMK